MGPTPSYETRAEKTPQNADFAMKQTNICRLSGDINYSSCIVFSHISIEFGRNGINAIRSADPENPILEPSTE